MRIQNIVIIGGGAGGLELAARLSKKLRSNKIKITLIDKSLRHLWKPLLHEVASGTLDSHEDELNYIPYSFKERMTFILGSLAGLNRSKKEILLSPTYDENNHEILPARVVSYDLLVVAIGSLSNDFSISGVREHCYFLDSLAEAECFQKNFLQKMLQIIQLDQVEQQLLKITIVGAGATGIELAAEMHYAFRYAIRYGKKPKNQINKLKIILIESFDRILPNLPIHLSTVLTKQLEKMQIEIMTGKKVVRATAQGVELSDNRFIESDITVWAAGVKAPDILSHLDGLQTNKLNQLCINSYLQTVNDEHIFALGDCSYLIQNETGRPVPPRAQAAHQEARLLAKSLINFVHGKPLLPYQYKDYGSLISLSRYNTAGTLMGKFSKNYFIEGKLARLFYLSLYKTHQITLYGVWQVALLTLAKLFKRKIKPHLKLH